VQEKRKARPKSKKKNLERILSKLRIKGKAREGRRVFKKREKVLHLTEKKISNKLFSFREFYNPSQGDKRKAAKKRGEH